MKLLFIFFIFLMLILLDKGLTILNVQQVWKNFPEAAAQKDSFGIEKNPINKFVFNRYGLYLGSVFMVFVSILTLFIIYGVVKIFRFNFNVSVYIVMMIYGLVIVNNFYFLLKYSKII